MNNNELIGFKSRTRNVLKPLQIYVIIGKGLEKKRREDNGDYGTRRTSYLRGSSSFSQGFGVYNQSKAKVWRAGRDENRWAVENYKNCPKRLYQSAQSAHETENKPEIKKASDCWQKTMKNLVAAGQFGLVWTTFPNAPRIRYPVLSIHSFANICKFLYEETWVCDRQEVYS